MQDGVEKLLWEQAWRVYGLSLGKILSEALGSYKRSAGFDEMHRLYPSTVGAEAFDALHQALIRQWPSRNAGGLQAYVELRARLREHIEQYLLRRLVLDKPDQPGLRDALFATDLGV